MNAVLSPPFAPVPQQRAMRAADVDAVVSVEKRAYSYPWSRGNFIDSLAAGYLAELLQDEDGQVLGYYLAVPGAGEMHLLNLTVAPEHQGRGWGRALMDTLHQHARRLHLNELFLEVRASNLRARSLYARLGYAEVGLRRGYYPAVPRREDAVVMRCVLTPTAAAAHVD